MGLILRIAVSVNAIGGGSLFQRIVRPPLKSPKTIGVKKNGKPYQVNRGKISSFFFKVSGLTRMSRN
ncbi:hypothetical protein AIX74_08710 [Salmonella enterica]|nr:hypothetical protein AIX74_08710 [Salmonella enterica]